MAESAPGAELAFAAQPHTPPPPRQKSNNPGLTWSCPWQSAADRRCAANNRPPMCAPAAGSGNKAPNWRHGGADSPGVVGGRSRKDPTIGGRGCGGWGEKAAALVHKKRKKASRILNRDLAITANARIVVGPPNASAKAPNKATPGFSMRWFIIGTNPPVHASRVGSSPCYLASWDGWCRGEPTQRRCARFACRERRSRTRMPSGAGSGFRAGRNGAGRQA